MGYFQFTKPFLNPIALAKCWGTQDNAPHMLQLHLQHPRPQAASQMGQGLGVEDCGIPRIPRALRSGETSWGRGFGCALCWEESGSRREGDWKSRESALVKM